MSAHKRFMSYMTEARLFVLVHHKTITLTATSFQNTETKDIEQSVEGAFETI